MYDTLSPDIVTSLLSTTHLGRTLHLLDQTDSTNSATAQLAQEGVPHGTVVWTDRQTAGRGRRGRTWYARPGTSLCFSVLLRPSLPLAPDPLWLGWIPLASAVGVAAGIERSLSISSTLKWPNDLLIQERKVGGLLCESLGSADRAPLLIIGVGLNVNLRPDDFPDELRGCATSLAGEGEAPVDRSQLLAHLLNELEPRLEHVCRGDLDQAREEYRQRCVTIGRLVRVDRQGDAIPLEGTAVGISDSGGLLIQARGGAAGPGPSEVVEVLAGDVVHLRSAMIR